MFPVMDSVVLVRALANSIKLAHCPDSINLMLFTVHRKSIEAVKENINMSEDCTQ